MEYVVVNLEAIGVFHPPSPLPVRRLPPLYDGLRDVGFV